MNFPSMKYIDNMPIQDRKKYAGHWIVVVNDKVVFHSKREKDTHDIVDMYDDRGDMPIVQHIWEKNMLLFHAGMM